MVEMRLSTDAYAHALSEGAAGHADAREAVLSGGVSLEAGAELAESLKFFNGEESAARHGAIDDGSDVALRDKEHILPVAFHGEFGGVVVEDVELHGSHPVGGAERAAGVAALGGGGHTKYVATHLRGDGFKFLCGFHDCGVVLCEYGLKTENVLAAVLVVADEFLALAGAGDGEGVLVFVGHGATAFVAFHGDVSPYAAVGSVA